MWFHHLRFYQLGDRGLNPIIVNNDVSSDGLADLIVGQDHWLRPLQMARAKMKTRDWNHLYHYIKSQILFNSQYHSHQLARIWRWRPKWNCLTGKRYRALTVSRIFWRTRRKRACIISNGMETYFHIKYESAMAHLAKAKGCYFTNWWLE